MDLMSDQSPMPRIVPPPPAAAPLLPFEQRQPVVVPRAAPVDVSILVVTWNSEAWITRCLASIPAACPGIRYEVIVYDNASADGTLGLAGNATCDDLEVVAGAENSGFAGGVNRAIERAKGRYLFILNPDCELSEMSVARLVEYMDSAPDASAAAPLLLDDDGTPQREFQLRRLPTLHSLAADILLFEKILPSYTATSSYRYRDLDITGVQPIEQPAAAALMIRKSVVNEVGGFDEGFAPAWFEDVDYCRRMAEAGHKIRLIPTATALHHGGACLAHVSLEEFSSAWYRNLFRYAAKWLPEAQVEMLRWMIIAGMLARSGAVLLGLVPTDDGRLAASRAYLRVAKEAFGRWAAPSRSS